VKLLASIIRPIVRYRIRNSADFERRVGANNICANVQEALDRARVVYEEMKEARTPAIA